MVGGPEWRLKEAEKWVEEKELKDKQQDETISSLSSYVDNRIEKRLGQFNVFFRDIAQTVQITEEI